MSGRTVFDVSQAIERQKLGRFLVGLVVISWIITFFDGFDSQAIAFAAPYLSTQYHLDRIMMGNIFSMGLVGTLIGGFAFGYLADRVGRRPAIILATAAFGLLTLAPQKSRASTESAGKSCGVERKRMPAIFVL